MSRFICACRAVVGATIHFQIEKATRHGVGAGAETITPACSLIPRPALFRSQRLAGGERQQSGERT